MRNLMLVARREYLEQIGGRSFRVSTFLVPLVFALIVAVAYFSDRGVGDKHIIVAAPSSLLGEQIRAQIAQNKDSKMTVDVVAPEEPGMRPALVAQVRTEAVDGLFWVQRAADGATTATFTSRSSGNIALRERLQAALNHALAVERMTTRGMHAEEVDTLLKTVDVDTLQVTRRGEEIKSSGFGSYFKGYFMALLLSMTTMIYGMNVARSIIQEKTSRIFEVMLAIATPDDMLAGKLLGVGAVGLTQMVIWAAIGAVIAGYPAAMAVLSGTLSIHFSWVEGVLFVAYFVLGYLLYASMFAGLAASCETEQELQMYAPLAALPIWLSFSLIWLVINDPSSVWSVAASLFPPTAPIIMMLRLGSEFPAVWQVVVSIGLMVASIWAVLWVSARLYRVGILMYGKRATLPELVRWLRYS